MRIKRGGKGNIKLADQKPTWKVFVDDPAPVSVWITDFLLAEDSGDRVLVFMFCSITGALTILPFTSRWWVAGALGSPFNLELPFRSTDMALLEDSGEDPLSPS